MSFVVYAAVILVAAASAIFGLDLLSAPLPQQPSTQVADTASPNRLAQREADRKQEAAEATRADDRALTPVFPTNAAGSPETTGVGSADDKSPALQTNQPVAEATPVAQQSSNRCDVSACAAAYSSFRASDCTYQPYSGARRVCGKSSNGAQRAADSTTRTRSIPSRRDVELRERVRDSTSARGDSNDSDAYDAPARRRVIIERGYGGSAFGRW